MQGDSAAPPASDGKQPAQGPGDAQWQYKPDDGKDGAAAPQLDAPVAGAPAPAPLAPAPPAESEVTWTASEFIAHSKGVGWYAVLASIAIVLLVTIYFTTRDAISMAAVIIMAVLIAITARRKPRVMEYRLDSAGLSIGPKFYPYSDFRAFSVVDEGVVPSIMFAPLKRFMTPLSIYYDPKDEERIIAVLSHYLPVQQQGPDAIDRFARRVRF